MTIRNIILIYLFAMLICIITEYYKLISTLTFCAIISIVVLFFSPLLSDKDQPEEEKNKTIEIIFTIFFFIFIFVSADLFIASNKIMLKYVFKDKPQQEFCGIFQQEYSVRSGRSSITYWSVENPNSNQKFDFIKVKKYDFYKLGDKICVKYAIDERWQSTPYIYSIQKDLKGTS